MSKQIPPVITEENFGYHNGQQVKLFKLVNIRGTVISLTNYGATLVSWVTRDKNDNQANIVLGFDSFEEYVQQPHYIGATIGRCANLIDRGLITIDNEQIQLSQNFDMHHLHGGHAGFDKKIWKYNVPSKSKACVAFLYCSPHLEEGYPGNLKVFVSYYLNDADELTITYSASTDRPTIVNLTNHSYFNLSGNFEQTIANHYLQISSDYCTEIGKNRLPSGLIINVENTSYDYRSIRSLEQGLSTIGGYNMNFVITDFDYTLKPISVLQDKESGRQLTILSMQPGLQLFTANNFTNGQLAYTKKKLIKHNSICLEPQHFPNAPSFSHFPSITLLPTEEYRHKTIYQHGLINDQSTF